MLDSLFKFNPASELRQPLLPYIITIILLSTVNEAVASRDEDCSRTCPFTILGGSKQCTSAADICACERTVQAAVDDLARFEREDCGHPMYNVTVKVCEENRQQHLADNRLEVARREALLDQCRQQVGRASTGSPSNRNQAVSLSGQSFELRLVDDREGNIFFATLKFVGTGQAVWQYRSRHERYSRDIQGRGTVEVIGSTAVFNDGKGDWVLEFSPGYREVQGTYEFWQERPGKPRTRHYEVTGVTSKDFRGWPGLQ